LLPCAPETLSSFCHVSRFIGTRGFEGVAGLEHAHGAWKSTAAPPISCA
jgi:hypothetical protein